MSLALNKSASKLKLSSISKFLLAPSGSQGTIRLALAVDSYNGAMTIDHHVKKVETLVNKI
jgi:hypothetical protein